MVLQPIEPPSRAFDGGHHSLLALRNHLESLRQLSHLIPMAHPHNLPIPNTLGPENPGILLHHDLHLAILLLLPNPNDPAEALHNQLKPVADSEDEDAVGLGPLREAAGEAGGVVGVDGVGPAGEDDDGGVEVGDGLEGAGAGDGEGEDGEGADAAGDEVGVLGAVVEDENKVGLHGFWVHGGRRRRRRRKGLLGFKGFVRGE